MSYRDIFSTIIIAIMVFMTLTIISMQKATIDGLLEQNETLECQLINERGK